MLAELLNGEGSAELTFAAYGLRVLEEREKTHADARQDQSRWRNHVVGSQLGSMALDAVRQVHVRRFYKSLGNKLSKRTGRPLSISLIRSIKSAVRQVFRAAVDAEVLETSTATSASPSATRISPKTGSINTSVSESEAPKTAASLFTFFDRDRRRLGLGRSRRLERRRPLAARPPHVSNQ